MLKTRKFLLFIVALLGLFSSARSENVEILSDSTLDDFVEENEYVLVMFHAPWCGHCKALNPEYEKLGKMLQESGSDVRIASVDITKHDEVTRRFGVKGYPTLIYFNHGKHIEYPGTRDAKHMMDWLKSNSGPRIIKLETLAALDDLRDSKPVIVVGYFKTTSAASRLFEKVSATVNDVTFALVDDIEISEDIPLTKEGLALIRQGSNDEAPVLPKQKITTIDVINKWIQGHRLAPVTEFTENTVGHIIGGLINNVHFLFVSETDDKFGDEYKKFEEAAKNFRTKVIFTYVDVDKEESARIIEFFGIDIADAPTSRILKIDDQSGKKFKPSPHDSYESFTKKHLSGNARLDLNSEPLPKNWDSEDVKVLVASNFKKFTNSEQNVVVFLYTPWCKPCQLFIPVLEELAAENQFEDDIVFAKMDIYKNEILNLGINHVPAIQIYRSGIRKPFDYNGTMEKETVESYIKEILAIRMDGDGEKQEEVHEEEEEDDEKEETVHEEL